MKGASLVLLSLWRCSCVHLYGFLFFALVLALKNEPIFCVISFYWSQRLYIHIDLMFLCSSQMKMLNRFQPLIKIFRKCCWPPLLFLTWCDEKGANHHRRSLSRRVIEAHGQTIEINIFQWYLYFQIYCYLFFFYYFINVKINKLLIFA